MRHFTPINPFTAIAAALLIMIGFPALSSSAIGKDKLWQEIVSKVSQYYYDDQVADEFSSSPRRPGDLPKFVSWTPAFPKVIREGARQTAADLGISVMDFDGKAFLVPHQMGGGKSPGLFAPGFLKKINGSQVTGFQLAMSIFGILGAHPSQRTETMQLTIQTAHLGQELTLDLPYTKTAPNIVEHIRTSNGLSVIRMLGFSDGKTLSQLQTIVAEQQPSHLVLDLRYSNGGSIREMLAVAGYFLGRKKLVAELSNTRNDKSGTLSTPIAIEKFYHGKVTILAGTWTYSASEIFVLALRQWRRAVVIGTSTYGKCLVQRQFHLHDKSFLKIPVAVSKFQDLDCFQLGVPPNVMVLSDTDLDDLQILSFIVMLVSNQNFICTVQTLNPNNNLTDWMSNLEIISKIERLSYYMVFTIIKNNKKSEICLYDKNLSESSKDILNIIMANTSIKFERRKLSLHRRSLKPF